MDDNLKQQMELLTSKNIKRVLQINGAETVISERSVKK